MPFAIQIDSNGSYTYPFTGTFSYVLFYAIDDTCISEGYTSTSCAVAPAEQSFDVALWFDANNEPCDDAFASGCNAWFEVRRNQMPSALCTTIPWRATPPLPRPPRHVRACCLVPCP